jgi:hypothetical protein
MKKSIFYGLLLTALIIISANTDNYAGIINKTLVKGVIIDELTNHPAAYSSIALFREDNSFVSYGTIANDNGTFTLKNLPYGNYYFVVYQIGYYKKYIFNLSISDKNKKINLGNIKLFHNFKKYYEVEIYGNKNKETKNYL